LVNKSRDDVAEARGKFGNPEEGNRPLLEAVTGGLVRTEQAEKTGCSGELYNLYSTDIIVLIGSYDL
jgi:hypothetical protein